MANRVESRYSVNPRFCGVRWQSESASGDTALAESDGRELRGCTFAKSQSGVATSFSRRTPYNAALPNVYSVWRGGPGPTPTDRLCERARSDVEAHCRFGRLGHLYFLV